MSASLLSYAGATDGISFWRSPIELVNYLKFTIQNWAGAFVAFRRTLGGVLENTEALNPSVSW